jgi:hypothetical protein
MPRRDRMGLNMTVPVRLRARSLRPTSLLNRLLRTLNEQVGRHRTCRPMARWAGKASTMVRVICGLHSSAALTRLRANSSAQAIGG